MRRGILYVVIVRKKRDQNELPPGFWRFIGIMFAIAILTIVVGKAMGYKIFF